MSSDQAATKDESSGHSKGGGAAEQAVKCPRCDSPNTKFCYYNNYSLTQPRHFCKTCRRYWTKGGALRNVPIGGGCRKNKKIRSSSSTTRLSDSELKFFTSPPMDFQLSYPRVQHQYSGAGHYQFPSSAAHGLEMSYPPPNQEMNNKTTSSSSLASSIESLSCINQDLHWKLQQQRLAMLLGTTADNNSPVSLDQHQQKQDLMTMQPILFQNLDISSKQDLSRKEAADVATEWFFGNSYANQSTDATRTGGTWTSAGVQGWTDLHQQQQQNHYTALP